MRRIELEAELQEALHDQRFYAEEPDSDSEYLQACKDVERINAVLITFDSMNSWEAASLKCKTKPTVPHCYAENRKS